MSYESTMLKLENMTKATNAAQMAWQEKMSGQSHQLEVSDLVKAGLNPVLSANQGAQSYTTSLDSGANAIANTYSAHESASATRYAARQSAAATRAAAAAQLQAAKYAADIQFEGNKYGWDMKDKIQKGINQTNLDIVDKTPPKNVAGLVWKMFDQSGLRKEAVGNRIVKDITGTIHALLNNTPSQNFKQIKDNHISMKNFVLNSNGVKKVNSALKTLGVKPTVRAQRLFVKAFVFHDGTALRLMASMLPSRSSSSRNVRQTLLR